MADNPPVKNDPFLEAFDLHTPFFSLFKLDLEQRTITYRGKEKHIFQLLTSIVLNFSQIYTFKFKIIKAKKRSIFIGVTDRLCQRLQENSYSSGNAICYYGGGRVWHGPVDEGKCYETDQKIEEGDIVTMKVNREKGKISWKVNNKIIYALSSATLQDQKR